MKSILIVILSVLTIGTITGQDKAYFSVSPLGANDVTGLMINIFPLTEKHTVIKGLELEVSPLSPMLIGISLFHIFELTFNDYSSVFDDNQFNAIKEVYGVHLGMVNIDHTTTDGIEINALNFGSSCHGLSISAINITNEINGVSIGAIRNFAEKCNGVQIGLINESDDLRGFQFGLWNKNSKRSLPFINWNFSNDKEESE